MKFDMVKSASTPNYLKKCILNTLICGAFLVTPFKATAAEEVLNVEAEAAILMEAQTGQILFEQNADEALPPASLTKIMTLTVAMEALEEGKADWEDQVTISQKAHETGGSQMFLNYDQEVPFRELIKGIAIVSANDACVAVAEHLSGSKEAFVEQMNQQAEEIGLNNSSFTNASGLHHDEHYMSAKDVAKLSRYLINHHPEASELQAETEFTVSSEYIHGEQEISQENRNPLLDNYSGADGIKTGWTPEAGHSLAGTAERNDMRFISVVMNADDNEARKIESEKLLDYGFDHHQYHYVAYEGESVDKMEVYRGDKDYVSLQATKDLKVVVPQGEEENLTVDILPLEEPEAPIEKGTELAEISISYQGEKLLDSFLTAEENIERLGFLAHAWDQIVNFLRDLWD